jgi:hypothetical protein
VEPFLIPVILGLIVAYFCVSGVSMTLFDVILEFKNFPYMPTLGSVQAYFLAVGDIMNKNFLYLTWKSKLADITTLMMQTGDASVTVPVVESDVHK